MNIREMTKEQIKKEINQVKQNLIKNNVNVWYIKQLERSSNETIKMQNRNVSKIFR